ncbi:hypothetical protein E2C01_032774 [Portunus trituberculatus]|uniref:Secreted protein n=1 Tax=Portunus trituberculatus TaxID=210409 RepID=A0A5B7F3S9_PORTR|nr:hypothetical protein [Portunus trituberculatus]
MVAVVVVVVVVVGKTLSVRHAPRGCQSCRGLRSEMALRPFEEIWLGVIFASALRFRCGSPVGGSGGRSRAPSIPS